MSERIHLVLDYDDVLVRFIPGIVKWSNENFGTSPEVSDYCDDWACWWGLTIDAAVQRRNELWESGVTIDFPTMPKSTAWLRKLSEHGLFENEVKFSILTSRPIIAKTVTCESVEKHFSGLFREEDIAFAGFFDGPLTPGVYNLSKGELFSKMGAHIAVDDTPHHVNGAATSQVPLAIHLDTYDRHKRAELHSAVRSAANWNQLMAHVLSAQSVLHPAA